jgi:hypothetical protein
MHWRQSTMLSYINYTHYPCILSIWISRQRNCANRTYQFLKELYSRRFALSYTRTFLGNKILICSWPSVISLRYPGMQSASFLRSIILSLVPCLVVLYFSTSHKGIDFRKKRYGTKCVFWVSLQLTSEAFLILRKFQWDIISINTSSHKVPVILVRF